MKKKEFTTDLLHFGYMNKNGRIYNKSNVDLNELNNRTVFGEINHHSRFDVNLSYVSHSIKDFEIYGDILYGEVKILNTPQGHVLGELMQSNSIVFRPRASGILNPNGTINNYDIYTFDAILAKDDSFDRTRLRREKLDKIMEKIKNKITESKDIRSS
jgi:hypothetical protein